MEETKTSVKLKKALQDDQRQQLIPGLPDEIAMECLVRVPYQFHSNMKSVCHTWQRLISHPSFYQQRLQSGTAEHLVCLVQPLPPINHSTTSPTTDDDDGGDPLINSSSNNKILKNEDKQEEEQQQHIHSPPQYALSTYNATHNIWQRTRPPEGSRIPMFCQCLALPSSGKLLLLGGWDPTTLEPVPHVYILDLIETTGAACKWRRGASMSVPRSFFACGVVGPSTVCVAGGHDSQKNALRSAEVYDVETDQWEMLPDMIEERDECQGLSWEGDSKFWVVSGYGTESQGQFRSDVEFYDRHTGCWSKIDGVWPFPTTSPRVVTTTVCVSRDKYQWSWFLGGEQQSQQQQSREVVKVSDNIRLEIVSSIPLPNSITGTTPCVTALDHVGQEGGNRRLFVMSGGGGRGSSTLACGECEGEGAFLSDGYSNNGTIKWRHIHTPVGFSGFPYSASSLVI
ncbi:F-box/kelch-repeat protein SKIP20 [Populus alba x Populus x berolinensis]|nr:F-box/kelch-repeat protein SKIP20 [Populus alba x Populus x berolinensis]